MASSSKRSRAASTKKSSTGTARRISIRRTDVLPRTGTASGGRRKPHVEPPIEAATEALAKPVAGSKKKKAHRPPQTEPVASRTKARRAAGRASTKAKQPAKAQPVAENPGAAGPAALEAAVAEAPAALDTEIVVESSAILEETTIATTIATALPPPPPAGKRPLVGAVWRLLTTLRRWTAGRR